MQSTFVETILMINATGCQVAELPPGQQQRGKTKITLKDCCTGRSAA